MGLIDLRTVAGQVNDRTEQEGVGLVAAESTVAGTVVSDDASAPRSANRAGLVELAGASAAHEVADTAARRRDLEAELRRSAARERGFQAAVLSEPLTASYLRVLVDQGWRVLHDRRWPGSTRANVDHLAIGYGGVAVIDTKHWSSTVQVRGERLWCGDDDRHDAVKTILSLTEAIDELLVEVTDSGPGRTLGLSAVHVIPILAFTQHGHTRQSNPRIGRVLLTGAHRLPNLLARRSRVLDDPQVALVAEYLAREMPPAVNATQAPPLQRRASVAVPIRPRPAPPPDRPEPEPLFDVAELAEDLTEAAKRPVRDWMGFLHPAQARLVKRSFNGPARIRGAAGTGKTVVLLHRAAWLATIRPGRVLVTTYVRNLPETFASVYRQLSPDTADRVDFINVHALARDILAHDGTRMHVNKHAVDLAFRRAWQRAGEGTPLAELRPARYWREEIDHVIKGRGLCELVEYEAIERRGRALRLTDAQKHLVWVLLQAYQDQLEASHTYDHNDLLSAALHTAIERPPQPGWSAVLVDEVQDLTLLGVRLCRELAGDTTDALLLVGDGQQTLYPGGFALAEARISVTGRAVVLHTNYRNTRQILDAAQQLVADRDFSDLDTTTEHGRRDVEVLRDGPPVRYEHATTSRGLALLLRQAMRHDAADGVRWGDMAVLCHNHYHLTTITERLTTLDVPLCQLAEWDGEPNDQVKIGTIHRSKGLDFSAVYVPNLTRPRSAGSGAEAADHDIAHSQREYVAFTRPRDRLWIGKIKPQSPRTDRPPGSPPVRPTPGTGA